MCTSVQNIHIPADGIRVNGEHVSFDSVVQGLIDAVEKHLANPANAAFLCGTLVSDDIYQTLERMRSKVQSAGIFAEIAARMPTQSSRMPGPPLR